MDSDKKDGPIIEDSTLTGFAKLLKAMRGDKSEAAQADAIDPVVTSSDTPKGYDDGGPVTAGSDPSFADKLKAVLAAMTQSPAMKAAGAIANPMGALMSGGADAILGGVGHAEAPMVNKAVIPAVNALSGANIPQIPTAQTPPPPAPMPAPVQAAPPPQPVAAPVAEKPPVAPVAAPKAPDATPVAGPAANMLQTMTGGDPEKLQAVLEQLKDQQTRGQFAKALAIIGDTFANVGMARGGKEPQGYKGTALVEANNAAQAANLQNNLHMQLANDPNSQTSRFAQQAAANILGIKPGDPRMAGLAKAPAAVLSAQLPSLGESIKPQLDREARDIQQRQFEETKHIEAQKILQQQKDREAQLAISAQGAKTAQEKERNELATGAVKDLSPMNPLNWGTISKAKGAINSAISGGEPAAPVQTVTLHGKQYSKINGQWVAH